MNSILKEIFIHSQSHRFEVFESALSDLRLLIERHTMHRYNDNEASFYIDAFYDKKLINVQLSDDDIENIKHFLIFILLNFQDRSVLIAKCIKVLFDESIREAICASIEYYLNKNDDTTCELIYAITDVGDVEHYFSNRKIKNVFEKVMTEGGPNSRNAVRAQLDYYEKYHK